MKPFETELCEIAYKYGTDKCPQLDHTYTPFYYKRFNPIKDKIKKVLEIGIGDERYRRNNRASAPELGASLKMWRDFFPNAQIYGVDIDPDTIFQDERIETHLCDAADEEALKNLLDKIGTDIDVVIDDGSHARSHQVRSCRILKKYLKKDVIYVIEDVKRVDYVLQKLRQYKCELPELAKLHRRRTNTLIEVSEK